jgi:hypothetical protein
MPEFDDDLKVTFSLGRSPTFSVQKVDAIRADFSTKKWKCIDRWMDGWKKLTSLTFVWYQLEKLQSGAHPLLCVHVYCAKQQQSVFSSSV